MEKLTKFRIWDCGFRKNTENPKSEIPNPKSDVGCRESGISTIFFLLLTLLISQSGLAQTCSQVATATENMTWTGAVSTDWNNPCNWSPNGVPTATNPVTIPDVANDPVVLNGTTAYAYKVDLGSGSLTVNVGGELNVLPTSISVSFFGLVINSNGTFTNRGTLNALTPTNINPIQQNGNSTFTNSGTVNVRTQLYGIALAGSNAVFTNEASGVINFEGSRGIAILNNITGAVINNQGTMNYTGTAAFSTLNPGTTFNNSGTIDIRSGTGIAMQGATMNNLACGKILMFDVDYENQNNSTTINAGLISMNGFLSNFNSTFTNNGVLKYRSSFGNIVNNQAASVIVKDALPIFTYGGTYNGTINGIFTNAAATTSAGTFTAPNTFTPSGLPYGSQTLYAKITPSGGACTYIVPFTYNNTTCTPVATATQAMTWIGTASTDWNNPCNWSPNGVPTATNPVQIDDVANDPVIMSGTVANFFNMNLDGTLTINNGGELKRLSGSNGIMINLGANSTLTNNGTLNLYTFNGNSLITLGGNNATFNNSGTANFSLEEHNLASIDLLSTNVKVNNTATGIMNFQNNSKAFFAGNNSTGTVTNQGIINYYTGIGYFADLKPNITFNNSGTVDVRNGQGFYIGGATLNNQACGKFYTTKYDNRNSSTTTNSGLMVITTSLSNSGGFFTNNGVLKYSGTPGNAITNNQNSSVIVNNALPIFTYGSSFNGTINGIFTDAAATTSAGTFTAPNTFTPSSGLPSGSQILYAKITPSGGACSYVVPFTYVPCNITLTAGTATNATTCGGANGSIAFTSTNLPNGMYDLSFTATGAGATASPQRVTVSGNAFNLAGLKAGTYSNFSITNLATGCTGTDATSKTVNDPATPTLVVGTRTHPTTCGGTEGSIPFTTTNLPNGNYTLDYSKNGTATSALIAVTNNAFTLSNLGAGTYTPFSITRNGCMGSVTTSRTLNNPAAPTLTAGIKTDPTTCGGTEGVIPFTSTNLPDGMYDLSFTATGVGATTSPQTVNVLGNAFSLSGLKAGTYTNFSITRNNCTGTSTASRALTDPTAPTLTAGLVTNTTTCGGTNGKIAFTTANLPNGTYELTYTEAGVTARVSKNVSVSSNAFNLLSLKAGTYSSFSITYNGCTATDATSKPVADPTTPTIVAGTAANPTTCGGVGSIPFTSTNLADGRYSLGFTATGTGATTSPQDVMVSGNAFTLSGLTVGTYSNFSLTRTGCTATHNVSRSIANPATPTLAAGVKVNPTTCGGTDGSIPFTTSLPNGMHQLTYTGAGSPKMVNVTSGAFTLGGLAAGGYSNFSVSLNGCTRTITASRSLNDPNPPVLTLGTATNPTACNLADGSIPFTATNLTSGTYALSYSANGVTTSKNVMVNSAGAFTLSGLADGTYGDFSIQNASGCTGSLETEVTLQDLALPVLAISGSNNPTTCSGTEGGISFTSTNLPDGRYSLSFTTTGTTSPKDVDVSGNAFTLSGLAAGNYSNFSITRLGCMGSVATLVGLTAPATPSVLAGLESHPTTCGGAEGEIDFTTTNLPNGRYSLSFTASSGATASPQNVDVSGNAFTLTGLKKGTYSNFSITNNNCTGSDATSKMLNDPASPTITAGTPINPTTCSAADGSIPFTSTNLPDDDYTLTYTGAGSSKIVSVLNNAFSLTGLDNGTYSNFSLSNNGCTASHNISKTVANPTAPTLTAGLATNPTTCASTDGKIAFTTTLADGSYTLTYTGAGSSKMINVASGAFELTGLADGTYSNFRIAHSGCTSIASTSKTLSDPTPPTITAGTPTNTTTCGGSDGTIPFTTSLPDGQYNINYTGGNGSQMVMVTSGTFTLTGLTAGTYSGFSVTVGGCTGIDNTSKTVSDPAAPTLSGSSDLSIADCGGTGRISFIATNLSPTTTSLSISFTATGANATPSPQTVSVTHIGGNFIFPLLLKAGVYSNFSFTHNGCTATSSTTQTFTDPEPPTLINVNRINVLCHGGSTGQIAFTGTGGSSGIYSGYITNPANQRFSLSGSSTFTASNLSAGVYTIEVERNGCYASQNIELTQPATPLSMSTTKTDVTVNGGNNGTITVTASGGTGSLQFSKDGGVNYTTGTSPFDFNNLIAGDYQIRVKDANACETAISTVTITQPTSVNFTTSETNILCNGASTGEIEVNVTNGTSPFEFSKDDGATFVMGANPFTFNRLSAGTYKIKVKDNTGFVTSATSVELTQPAAATATQEMTWTGAVSTDWNNACNWSPNGIPTATNRVNIPDVANDPVILSGTVANCFKMFIDGGSSPNLTINSGGELNVLPTNTSGGAFGVNIGTGTLTNRGTLNALSTANLNMIVHGTNSTFINSGTLNLSTAISCITLFNTNINFTNEASGIINFQSGLRGFVTSGGATGNTINNLGTMNYTPNTDFNFAEITAGNTFNNSGTIDAKSGAISMYGGTLNNLACGKILIPRISTLSPGPTNSTTTNAGFISISTSLDNTGCTFTNNGVLKYNFTRGNAIINNQISSVIVNNSLPIFTYGGTYNGTINGIFTDDAATTSAGTFTAPNTFAPSGLTCGSQTLYAKITPSGGACTYVVPFTYTPVPPTVSTTKMDVTTNGGNNGKITVTASGGTGSLQFSKDGGITYVAGTSPFDFTTLTAGDYQIRVKDANGCETANSAVTITQPTAVNFTTSETNILCNGATTGAIQVNVTNGTSPFEFSKDDGATFTAGSNPFTFNGLAAATYKIKVKDNTGFITSATSVTLTQPTPLSILTSKTNVTVNGGNNGKITVTASGGTGALQFSKDGGTTYVVGTSPFDFTTLTAGDYQIRVKDANACETAISTVTITQPTAVNFTTSETNILCNGASTGAIQVNVTNGTSPFQFSKDDGATFTAGSNPFTFNGLAAATYKIKVKDQTGFITSATSVTLTQPTPLSMSTAKTNVTINGGNNGTITVTASGGTGSLQFSKDGGTTYVAGISPYDFTTLTAGDYQIRVKDANACETAISTVTITQPTAVNFTTTETNITCNGATTGAIQVNVTNGTSPFEYSKDDGATFTAGTNPFTFNGLVAGDYKIKVKDQTGFVTAATTVTLTQAAPLSISVGSKQNKDCSNPTGAVSLTVGGGTGGLQVSLDGTNFQSGLTFNNIAPNNYIATVKDANNCTQTTSFIISDNGTTSSAPTVANVEYCQNETPSVLTASGTNLKWYTTPTGSTASTTAPIPSTAMAGTVSYWVSQSSGLCESGRAKIDVITKATPTITMATPPAICARVTSFIIPYTATTGTPTTYSISGTGITTVTDAALPSGSITVSLSTAASGSSIPFTLTVKNVSGCTSTSNASVLILSKPTITLTTQNQVMNEGNSQTLCDTDANPVNGLQFTVSGSCVSGNPVWRVQVGNGVWSEWSSSAPTTQLSNNQPHRYQAACDANCPTTYTDAISVTINYRASTPQNVSMTADGTTVLAGEEKSICDQSGNSLTFNATCAAGEILLYSVDGGVYLPTVPAQIVDGNFHNYRVRCQKSDGTPSCFETESGLMRLKISAIVAAPVASLNVTSGCGTPSNFIGTANCGSLTTVWYNATTNVALPNLPTTTPNETTSYYARCQNTASAGEAGCQSGVSNTVTFTVVPVNTTPTITVSSELVCTGVSVTVSASCPTGSSVLWNTGVTENSFSVAFNNVTTQGYSAKCVFENGCQSAASATKTVRWKAFELTIINIGQSKSVIKTNDRAAWVSQFVTADGGPSLDNSTESNPTLYYTENANKTGPRYWTIHADACALGTSGSLTFDMLLTPETGVAQSFNTHENNAPYFMYANRDGYTELYAQNHPAYGFYEDNGSGGNIYDAGLPKGLYKLGIRYWDQKGQGSIYPSTRQAAGKVLAYQEYWFRIQSKDGVGTGAARVASDNNLSSRRDLNPLTFAEVVPNPVSNSLRLLVNDAKNQKVNVSLIDASGRTLMQHGFTPETNTHQEEFNVSELANGMYFLKVNAGEKQATLKVVKVQ